MKQLADLYKRELLDNVLPFWIAHSRDEEQGGFFTCLDRQGKVFDTDKFMWLQGREVWMFSMLYDKVKPDPAWKDMALLGAGFLKKHGRDENGNWYFSTTREGKPLIQPYNIFSDCFAAMGFGALYKIEPNPAYHTIAKDTFENILRRRNDPKGKYTKNVPGTRPLKNFALPMILCNLSLELEHILGSEKVNEFIPEVLHEVMDVFYHKETGLVLENVLADGSFSDSFEGRLLNPGHAIEAMWFIMDLAVRLNDPQLARKACDIGLRMLEYGWDKEHGGIFYFMDIHHHPQQQLEWDQKLWWVHLETLVFLAKGWQLTGDEACRSWFEKVHAYTWEHFRDSEHPEWFGYLNRQGQPLLQLKGGKWKGCFHVPRALYQVWQTLENAPAFQVAPVIV